MKNSTSMFTTHFETNVVDVMIHSLLRHTLHRIPTPSLTIEGEKETNRRGTSRSRHCWIVMNTDTESEAITTNVWIH